MKTLLFILTTLVFSNGNQDENFLEKLDKYNGSGVSPYSLLTANMDAYTDEVMVKVGPWISTIIPMQIPDFKEEISYRPVLITYTGVLNLEKGSLTKLQSVGRVGPAIMTYDNVLQFLRVAVTADLKNFEFKYDYSASIWNIGGSGWLVGQVDSFVMASDFIMDMDNFIIYMQDFRVVSLGKVSISLKGNWLTDWLASIIVNSVTKLFKSSITAFVSDALKDFVQETIDKMNEIQFQYSNQAEFQQKIMDFALSLKQLNE